MNGAYIQAILAIVPGTLSAMLRTIPGIEASPSLWEVVVEPLRCEIDGCDAEVEIALAHGTIEGSVEERHYCTLHGDTILDSAGNNCAAEHLLIDGSLSPSLVYLKLVVSDSRLDGSSQMQLHEIDGERRLSIPTGRFESWLLQWEMRREPAPSLSTHQAMASLIRSVGAVPIDATVYDVSENKRYYAQVQISHGTSSSVVDMRPYDALALATVCSVPIYVHGRVWNKLAGGIAPP